MRKSPDAFRTISEVAQDLDLPQHVLRFWETRFTQIKPMKRGGGRRYYRPDDIDLLKGIRHLLYDEGYTIKGVQRILKDQGVRHVIDTVIEDSEVQKGAETAAAFEDVPLDVPPLQPTAHREPNQLELTRPPLVAPPAASTMQPTHHDMASSASVNAALVTAQPGIAAAPAATAMSEVAHVQPTAAIHSIHQSAQAKMLPQASGMKAEMDHAIASPQSTMSVGQQGLAEARAIDPALQPTAPIPVSPAPLHHKADANPVQDHQPQPSNLPPGGPAITGDAYALPQDLVEGEPKFVSGESASISVSDAQRIIQEQNVGNSLINRLRGRVDEASKTDESKSSMARDDIRRLQSTLFELLECKRILDQARSTD